MSHRITRRKFATAGAAAALGLPVLDERCLATANEASPLAASGFPSLPVRPYQLMCVICRLGAGCTGDLGDPRLTAILEAVRQDPKLPVTLRCNVDTVYRYQNPGHAEDTAEGELFNAKRDLDIIHKLGLAPGDTRPAIDIFERVLAKIPQTRGICGYETQTSDTWRGCTQADSGNYEKGHKLGIHAIIPPRDPAEKAQYKKTTAAAVYQAKTLQIRPHHLLCMSCFHGGKDKLAPISEDNLFEAIDAIQKQPDIPVTLIAGVCMICPPCGKYDPVNKLCVGGRSMALRDQKKDLDVLQKLGLKYGDTLPARKLYKLVFERISSTRDICGYGDGETRAYEWSICGSAVKDDAYQKARAARLGIKD
ncbi:MAG TPA: hypothetical protein PLF81_04160 [Candidatus Anammoximicrobium sp.]|nr:hypothetical protein [Candidatus Anammoximicrobium sp.]